MEDNYFLIGICIFLFIYGLMEGSNGIYVYSKIIKSNRNSLIVALWGVLFILFSISLVFGMPKIVKSILCALWGFSWFPLVLVRCTLPLFRKDKTTKLIRKILLFIVGISELIVTVLVNI
jgi:hypothetical protein